MSPACQDRLSGLCSVSPAAFPLACHCKGRGAVIRIAIGVLVGLSGAVWIGQGFGLIPGSFMSGDRFWALAGAVAVVIGFALALSGWRAQGRRRP